MTEENYLLNSNPKLKLWEPSPLPVRFGSPGYQWADSILATEDKGETTLIQFTSGSFAEISTKDFQKFLDEGEAEGIYYRADYSIAHYQLTKD